MNANIIYSLLRARSRIVEYARIGIYYACARERTPCFFNFSSLLGDCKLVVCGCGLVILYVVLLLYTAFSEYVCPIFIGGIQQYDLSIHIHIRCNFVLLLIVLPFYNKSHLFPLLPILTKHKQRIAVNPVCVVCLFIFVVVVCSIGGCSFLFYTILIVSCVGLCLLLHLPITTVAGFVYSPCGTGIV